MSYLDILNATKNDSLVRFENSSIYKDTEKSFRSFNFYSFLDEVLVLIHIKNALKMLTDKLKGGKDALSSSDFEELLNDINVSLNDAEIYSTHISSFILQNTKSGDKLETSLDKVKAVVYLTLVDIQKMFPDKWDVEMLSTLYVTKYKASLKGLKAVEDELKVTDEEILNSVFVQNIDSAIEAVLALTDSAFDEYEYLIKVEGYTPEELEPDKATLLKGTGIPVGVSATDYYNSLAQPVSDKLSLLDSLFDEYEFTEFEDIPLVELGMYWNLVSQLNLVKKYPYMV